jgi:4-hydroxybenzoate polyprenyltransferase
MRKFFQPILDFVLFSNLFMALCAVAQALLTIKLIGGQPVQSLQHLLALLFTSTLVTYNISIFLSKPKEPQKSEFKRVRWFFAHNRLMISITIISTLTLIPLFWMLGYESKLLMVFLGFISIGYSLPLFTIEDKKFGLRNIPGLKSLMITLVWVLSCVLLPIFEAQRLHLADTSLHDTAILLSKRFLFVFALTIPFDIRDLFHDRNLGLKTIPVMIGEKKAYLFCQLLLIGYVILLFTFKNNGLNADFFALTLSVIVTGWLIFKSEWEKEEYYYFLFMDGVLILQYLLLILFRAF